METNNTFPVGTEVRLKRTGHVGIVVRTKECGVNGRRMILHSIKWDGRRTMGGKSGSFSGYPFCELEAVSK